MQTIRYLVIKNITIMKNLQTMNFGAQQPQIQFPSQTRCLLLVNERKVERKAMDMEGNESEEIITSYDYDGTFLDVTAQTEAAVLEAVKSTVLREIEQYDSSPAVNGFLLNGSVEWIDIDLRIKLCTRTLPEEKKAGNTSTVLWLGNKPYELPIETIEQIMHEIEIYAKACLDVTNSHKAKVLTLSDVSALVAYDYTAGYPEKLSFNI